MNRAPLIFLGVFLALAFSWTGIVLVNQIAYGSLTPIYDENESKAFPEPMPGIVKRGELVYQDLGCVYCHTQQVRRPGYGSDIERGWGERGSVARDYIYENRVMLGTMRTGPDLRNIGARQSDETWHLLHLYDPQLTSRGSVMPPYRFLFEMRKIVGEPSPDAISIPTTYTDGVAVPAHSIPAEGYEVVPTARAKALVAYLIQRKDTYGFPEAFKLHHEKAEEEDAADSEEEGN
ncbi:cbb3-type cytochrome c oxidase subunit II [Actomonas aquatica]|uniref:Cbb3-type cytochrome c oxidase subunit II n=1 Tax=Actomonas aquatica TaxID=2866162 RepID=A0ABZ1CBK7_9BACT|nr:cbb3-type cytochrome c oxidase subunit II [Opitutus sp. WL0086]WRQ88969.1 cbb3-type cytochrome c oxidase subunit II [Opitutus sp. WL0086]